MKFKRIETFFQIFVAFLEYLNFKSQFFFDLAIYSDLHNNGIGQSFFNVPTLFVKDCDLRLNCNTSCTGYSFLDRLEFYLFMPLNDMLLFSFCP